MKLKIMIWLASSKKDLLEFPEEVKDLVGYALYVAQKGEKHEKAKPLKGFGSAHVLEIVDSDPSGTYRVVYTIEIKDMIFVVHAFQKKSKQGIKTPKQELDLIKTRLKQAHEMYKEKYMKNWVFYDKK